MAVLLGGAFVVYAGQVCALHCDETNVLRHATSFAGGRFGSPGRPGLLWLLLAPFVWLGDPVVVTRALRLTAAVASVATLWGVLSMAGTAADPDERTLPERRWAGALAVLLLATSMDWQGHAFELRTDSFVMPLTLVAMLQLWRQDTSLRRAALAGVLIAATGLFSQKSVYNAGAIAVGWGVYVLCSQRPWRLVERLKQAGVVVAAVVACGGAWFGLLSLASERGASTVSHTFSVATRTAFGFNDLGWDHKIDQLRIAFERAPVVWVLFALAVPWVLVTARRRPRVAAATAAALVMLSTIAFHRGFRTYYVASLEPYMVLAGGGLLGWGCSLLRRKLHLAVPVAVAAAVLGVAIWQSQPHVGPLLATDNRNQLRLMRDAHEAFDGPVPYMDMLSLLPVYPEVTFLSTGHQRTLYRKRAGVVAEAALGEGASASERQRARKMGSDRAFITAARTRKPLFFIRDYMSRDRYFRKAEMRWFWSQYLPYRPNLYIHGGRILVDPDGDASSAEVELLADGEYTVFFWGGWTGEASIGDRPIEHGQVIELTEGTWELTGRVDAGNGELWVMYGRDRTPEFDRVRHIVDWSMFPRDRRDRFQQYDNRKPTKKKPGDLRTPDHDTTMTDRVIRKRTKRHADYQVKRRDRDGTPRREVGR